MLSDTIQWSKQQKYRKIKKSSTLCNEKYQTQQSSSPTSSVPRAREFVRMKKQLGEDSNSFFNVSMLLVKTQTQQEETHNELLFLLISEAKKLIHPGLLLPYPGPLENPPVNSQELQKGSMQDR